MVKVEDLVEELEVASEGGPWSEWLVDEGDVDADECGGGLGGVEEEEDGDEVHEWTGDEGCRGEGCEEPAEAFCGECHGIYGFRFQEFLVEPILFRCSQFCLFAHVSIV